LTGRKGQPVKGLGEYTIERGENERKEEGVVGGRASHRPLFVEISWGGGKTTQKTGAPRQRRKGRPRHNDHGQKF